MHFAYAWIVPKTLKKCKARDIYCKQFWNFLFWVFENKNIIIKHIFIVGKKDTHFSCSFQKKKSKNKNITKQTHNIHLLHRGVQIAHTYILPDLKSLSLPIVYITIYQQKIELSNTCVTQTTYSRTFSPKP